MSEAELIEITSLMDEMLSVQFQTWLSVTFAAIVAAYAAGERLNYAVRLVASTLYASICVVLYLKYEAALELLVLTFSELNALGSYFKPGDVGLIASFRALAVIGGSFFTLLLILWPRLSARRKEDA